MFFKSASNWYLSENGGLSPTVNFNQKHGVMPDTYYIGGLDYMLVHLKLMKEFKSSVRIAYRKTELNSKGERALIEAMYDFPTFKVMLQVGAQTYYGPECTRVYYCTDTPEWFLSSMIEMLLTCQRSTIIDSSGYLEMMVSDRHGLDFTEFKINQPKLNLEDVYPSEFLPIHQKILNRLNTADSKGLVILHGEPGTGKTTYIRYLISLLKKRKIFISPNMTHILSSPDFIKSLQRRSDSVLIIEDAESILMTREGGGSDAVSNLLNLSDGLLADCFNIQVICTFNTQLENIDPALLRKGRLIARYEFPRLTAERAQSIAKQLGKDLDTPDAETSLADLFDPEGAAGHVQPRKRMIGFQFAPSDDKDDEDDDGLPF